MFIVLLLFFFSPPRRGGPKKSSLESGTYAGSEWHSSSDSMSSSRPGAKERWRRREPDGSEGRDAGTGNGVAARVGDVGETARMGEEVISSAVPESSSIGTA